jgi:cardiolipin synthase
MCDNAGVHWWFGHLGTVIGAICALVFAGSLVRSRKPSGSTAAWLLAILLVPWLGVPLYFFFGGRKLRRANEKPDLARRTTAQRSDDPIERVLISTGAGAPEPGHAIEWHGDGQIAFGDLCATIDAATRSIRIATFVLGDDDAADAIVDKLVARAQAGVHVELLLDGMLVNRSHSRAHKKLAAAGGKVAVFEPLFRLPGRNRGRTNLRNHRKICVVDGEVAILGGRNLAHEYMGPEPDPARWDDLSWRLRGPAVARADEVFRADWKFATGEELPAPPPPPPAGDAAIALVPSGPDASGDPIYEVLLQLAFTASRRLSIATPYFTPDPALEHALELAVRRGVEVRVIVPARSNHRIANLVGRSFLSPLAAIGVQVFQLPKMLHAKVVLADDWVVTGSANFDMRSLFLDFEMSMVTRAPTAVAWIEQWFERECARCVVGPIAPSTLSDLARLVAPLV